MQVEISYGLSGSVELVRLLDLVSSRADHVEATHVTVEVHVLLSDLNVVVDHDTLGSLDKTEES